MLRLAQTYTLSDIPFRHDDEAHKVPFWVRFQSDCEHQVFEVVEIRTETLDASIFQSRFAFLAVWENSWIFLQSPEIRRQPFAFAVKGSPEVPILLACNPNTKNATKRGKQEIGPYCKQHEFWKHVTNVSTCADKLPVWGSTTCDYKIWNKMTNKFVRSNWKQLSAARGSEPAVEEATENSCQLRAFMPIIRIIAACWVDTRLDCD